MTDQEKLEFKDKYQNNPVAFVEDFYNVKLYPWQKVVLNAIHKKDKFVSFVGGRINQKKWLDNMKLEYMKTMEMNFEVWSTNGIDVYENGILVKTIKRRKD